MNTQKILSRIQGNQKVASELSEDLARSMNAQVTMPWLFSLGSFSMIVTGKYVRGNDHLPYCAHIEYTCGSRVVMEFHQWALLNRKYYTPEQVKEIESHWVRERPNF
jgi:hypothetical protein